MDFCLDPIKSRAQECAEKFGNHAKVYETAGELLADPGIDAVQYLYAQ